jgi:MoxR-like ATPase
MGAKRNVFVDEIFDARANAQRNVLTLLVERASPQGAHLIPAVIETVIAATNRYLSEVYEKAGDDGPKAVIDRFALMTFVPATFEFTDSYVRVIQRSKKATGAMPELRFDDLEALRALVPQVEISAAVSKALALLSMRMKAETEALEAASVKSYNDKLKNGEDPGVPYRATKYHSPRTIAKASAILKAFIVKDWVEKGGKRKLEATIQDLGELEKFFTLNGPGDAFVKS